MALLKPPPDGVAIRMYRVGHGDCFLLAFHSDASGRPFYVLIDCGYKPGSTKFVHEKKPSDIVKHIADATNRTIDLFIVTHEHQDHVNGISPHFHDFTIKRAWFAWTEDPTDDLANDLRRRHRDQLVGLLGARNALALAAADPDNDPTVQRLNGLLGLEWGGEDENPSAVLAAAGDPQKSVNKRSMKLVKDKASEHGPNRVRFLRPGIGPEVIPGTNGVRFYVLGPPRDEKLIEDEDPVGAEAFPSTHSNPFSFSAAAQSGLEQTPSPFAPKYWAVKETSEHYVAFYGSPGTGVNDSDGIEALKDAEWRRIDEAWLHAAEGLALKLNTGINNTSLVLAFELPKSRKVLLFVGDAQRGNWASWANQTWDDQGHEVTAKDILARTVLYKVGHHGSHNATLAGNPEDPHPNLSWMGIGQYSHEFTAMITAVNSWAEGQKPPWHHPLRSIKDVLLRKAQGRVFQTDEEISRQPEGMSDSEWQRFQKSATFEELFFDYQLFDK